MAGEQRVTRRQVLQGAASAAAVAGVGAAVGPLVGKVALASGSELPVRMAMHIHASFSEGTGSMQAHLAEAERVGVDVIWWTEHDHRMVARNYLTDVHFNGFTEWTNGVHLTWQLSSSGTVASTPAIAIVSKPASDTDPGGRAMRVSALSTGDLGGTRTATAKPKSYALNTSIDGTTITFDVRPIDVGDDAWFDIIVQTSYRPALSGRPAGQYRMRYRIGGGRPIGTVVETDPLDGLIVLGPETGRWSTITLDPVSDFTQLWPDIDFRDAALTSFAFASTSRNSTVSSTAVDGLHFNRVRKNGNAVLAVQRELMDHYTPLYPSVVQQQGVELSENTPHINWFGAPDIWPASDPANSDVALAIATVHASGGVASYNHPFGTSGGQFSAGQRSMKRRAMASTMVTERAFGADVVEVGYTGGRAGMSQSDYIALWDVMSRNLVFATGTGVTDDHSGSDWTGEKWRHVTGVWAQSTDVPDLQAALRSGRAWFYDPASFSGTLDISAAGFVPMGSVGMVHADRTPLRVDATGVPADWRVVVISGVADEIGTIRLDPQVTSRSYPASSLVNDVLNVKVPSAVSMFHRVVLRDAAGTIQAYSNPLWLLRTMPTATVPDQRWAVPDTTPSPSDSSTSGDPSPSDSFTSGDPSPSEEPSTTSPPP
ncbi:MAG: hypothetical protein ACJ73J_01165 [Actinomycetes bacterium]